MLVGIDWQPLLYVSSKARIEILVTGGNPFDILRVTQVNGGVERSIIHGKQCEVDSQFITCRFHSIVTRLLVSFLYYYIYIYIYDDDHDTVRKNYNKISVIEYVYLIFE